ncbi:hypothetical protein [Legionella shakespearei]|uniref:Uncharacterized protein n=1 Tax=Legionella shakespearei DSM 23087 TaxID=1122169 RepID=A0A0W0Z7L0_9GAMM|nr:hypothetical protein [Legionella shakespearei]KTD65106.1 hypothetical protein Lsha_0475 [Legionella shakespearei DSM 23087]
MFSLFSTNSFYHTTFKAHLDKEAIHKYLMLSSTPLQENDLTDETIDSSLTEPEEPSETMKQSESANANAAPDVPRPPITAHLLCQLAKAGNLSEIKKYTVSADVINTRVSHAILGSFAIFTSVYNALMVATAYRHLDVVQYFIEEMQADCSINGGLFNDISLIDCARKNWWFIAASDDTFIKYIEESWFKYKQKQLAHRFIEKANNARDESPSPEQQATLMSAANTESVCVKVAQAYEPTSSTQEILTFLSEAVELKDKVAAVDLGQRHQINPDSCDLNTAFDSYLKAAQLGQEDALIPLERLAQRVSSAKKLELSQMYKSFFHNEEKAEYWRAKSMELSNSSLSL